MRQKSRPLIYLLSAAISLILPSITHDANAEVLHDHYIVDSFADGVAGQSEVHALPNSIVEKIINNESVSYIERRQFCETLDVAPCTGDTGLSLRIYLPACSSIVTELCIEGLEISGAGSAQLIKAQYLGDSNGRSYAADPSRGFPQAGSTSLWSASGAKNSKSTETYAVKVLLDGFMTSTSKTLYIFDISAKVDGFTESVNVNSNRSSECDAWQSGTRCGHTAQLLEDQKVALSLRLPNTVTGWLNGRLKESTISVTALDAKQNVLRVEAKPVLVPEVEVHLTDAQFNSLPNPAYFSNNGESWSSVNAGNIAALEWIKQLSGAMKDTASGEHTSWFFATSGSRYGNNQCTQDRTRLIGLVTTNAAVYSPGAPDFIDGFLNYKVGGLHFRPDGKTPNLGTYDLLIRSDVARCLYNFTNAPLSATISIVDDSGATQQIATTVLNEKDGWLHLAAYGFTFSSPTLKVKLNGTLQKSTDTKAPSSAKRSSTITCVKGKQVKKLVGSKATCPKGWSRK